MKIYLQEFCHNYSKYLFGYTLHALREENDVFDELYKKGFLPYTGNTEIKNTYYMARSCRVDLDKFTLSSENRRVQKKITAGTFTRDKFSAEQLINDEDFINFCLEYFLKRHGEGIFSKERLQFILSFSDNLYIIKYSDQQGKAVAYVIEAAGNETAHYWFSFYDLNAELQSIGLWLILDCIMAAKENGLKYYYLGTVYGEKALYKTNFNSLEYWDGNNWLQNTAELKKLGRQDKEHNVLF